MRGPEPPGRVFMKEIDCPFRRLDSLLEEPGVRSCAIVIVDFHAEATAEKVAMARYADGRVTAVIGTHPRPRPIRACSRVAPPT